MQVNLRIPPTKAFFSFRLAHSAFSTILSKPYCILVSVRSLLRWRWHYCHDWDHCTLLYEFKERHYVLKELHHQKYYKKWIFPSWSFSSLRILRLTRKANTKELYKNYLRRKTLVLIKIFRLYEFNSMHSIFLWFVKFYVLQIDSLFSLRQFIR